MSWKDYVKDENLKKRIAEEQENNKKDFAQQVTTRANEIINKLNNTNGFEILGNVANKAEQAIDKGYTERQNQEYEKDKAEREQRQQQRVANAEGKGLLAKAGARIQNWGENIIQKPKAMYDNDGKFTFGDILRAKGNADRAVADTLLGAGTHAIGAIADMGKSGTAIAGYGTSAIARATGNDGFANKVQESTDQSLQDMAQFKDDFTGILDEESALGKSGNAMAESMAFSGTLGVSGKKVGNALLLATGLGNSLEESYKQEDLEDWQRWLQGAGSAYIGYFTEQIGDAFGFGGNGLTNTVKSAVMSKLQSGTAKFLARLGLNGAFEGTEEVVEPILDASLNWTVNLITDLVGHGGKFDTSIDIGDLVESYLSAFATGMAGSSNENSQGIDVDKATNQMVKEMRAKGYEVTKKDIKQFKAEALKLRENAIADDYKYASREEDIDESDLSDNQKAQLLQAVRDEDIKSKDLKEQIKQAETTNKEVEKKLDEYNVPEEQKQTLLQMTRESTDNSDMNDIADQVINDNRKMDAEINKQIQEIDNSEDKTEKFKEIINRNQRLLASQKADLIERYQNGDITDYEALREVRYMEAETAQNRLIRDNAIRRAGDQRIINDLNSNSTLGRLTYNNTRDNAMNFEQNAQKQPSTIENETVLPQEQQTTQEEPQTAQTQTSEKINLNAQKQLEIIRKNNPMTDDYHNGIRTVDDIKTFDEAIQDEESFTYGDYSKEDAQKDLENGIVTVYSSKPIQQGGFVSTSKNMAQDYAGNGKVYSQKVNINDVAWLNGDEGQYAKVEETTQLPQSETLPETNNNVEQQIKEIKENQKALAEGMRKHSQDKQTTEKAIKGMIMRDSAKIRELRQGDLLVKVDGGLTDKELKKKIDRLKSNYIGKEVSVDGKEGTISKNVYGKIEVTFNDGEKGLFEPKQITPLQDIDALIAEQQKALENQNKLSEASTTVNENVQPESNGIVARAYDESKQLDTQAFQQNMNENLYQDDSNLKDRSYPETVMASDYVDENAKRIAKKVLGDERYRPISNNETIDNAMKAINSNQYGADGEYVSFVSKFDKNERMTLQDIATAELLIQHYSYIGDKQKLETLIKDVSILGTELGQMVQALSIVKRQSPEFQIEVANKIAERLGKKYKVKNVKLSDEMVNKIKNTPTSDKAQMENVMSEAYEEIANQLPRTFWEQVNNWRYLAMLGNPKTHIRNITGNAVMHGLANIKNTVSGIIQSAYGATTGNDDYYQYNSYKLGSLSSNEDYNRFLKEELTAFGDSIDSFGNKYNDTPTSEVEQKRKAFNHGIILNSLAKANSWALDKEDSVFLKWAYRDAFRDYLVANNIDVETLRVEVDDPPKVKAQKEKNLNRVREYAVQQALEATFHQANAFATAVNKFTRTLREGNWVERRVAGAIDTILPFKKTPANILKTGVEYSPIGLVGSLGKTFMDSTTKLKELDNQLKSGEITNEEFGDKTSKIINNNIDGIAKGLTGSVLAGIGYFLAKAGIIKAGNDDDEDQFEESLGKQKYSINWNGYSVSLDWLSPSAMPFFIGAEFYKYRQRDDEVSRATALAHAITTGFNPAFETTMLNNVTSALTSYSSDSEGKWENMFLNIVQNYESQFISSFATNLYKTFNPDTTIRSTTSTKQDAVDKTIDTMWNQTKARLPITELYNLLDRGLEESTGYGLNFDETFAQLPEKTNKIRKSSKERRQHFIKSSE